ncbi:hypothetical protein EVJ58_g5650 [Rhodofomes roseus]|uniref:DNA helicase n=1 Tax=Rhodofomes roseus TaxID=34475 RepID=A0A4Y9YAR7_9APHY|nr:hypothetical protein EVJ58_g5650 [Rhodofomes roseus]
MNGLNTRGRSKQPGTSRGTRVVALRRNSSDGTQVVEELSGGEERVVNERARMVQERQAEMGEVADRHDTYVRERFHLEQFVTLVSYDPKTAKKDDSTVFREASMSSSKQDDVPANASAHVGKGKGKGKAVAELPLSVSPARRQSRPTKARDRSTELEDLPPPKRRRIESNGLSLSAAHREDVAQPTDRPPESISATPSGRRKPRRQLSPPRGSTSSRRRAEPVSPSQSPLKRIKLIVRRPDPVYSSPVQKPPPPTSESLFALLTSYTTLNGNDVSQNEVEDHVQQVADFWRRADAMRKEGRFFPESVGDESLRVSPLQRDASMNRSQDTWAHVLEAVKARAEYRPTSGRQVAAQVASRVRAYWETRAVKDDKIKLQDEKRLRALAKVTIRHVIDEWKKAVHHIRREEQLRREEEERIRGQEHLDAILNQSGQILTAQQLDLSKTTSRSRSSSVSAAHGHWASASPEPDDALSSEAEEAVASDDEPEENDESEGEQGVDTSILLGEGAEMTPRSPSSRSRSSMGPPTTDDASARQSPEPDFEIGPASQSRRSVSISESIQARTPSPSPTPTVETPVPLTYSPSKADWENIFPFAGSSSSLDFSPHDELVISAAASKTLADTRVNLDDDTEIPSVYAVSTNGATTDYMDVDEDVDQLVPAPEFQDVHTSKSPTMAADPPHEGDIRPSTPQPDLLTASTQDRESESAMPDTPRVENEIDDAEEEASALSSIPVYLRPYAVAPVEWDPSTPVKAPFLLRGNLRPYQQSGLEWLASLHTNNLNGILADEMGLGKTIQTISLLAHLACDRGIWGPHLIVVPTSVLLNWEMEFKKFLPGFKVLSYHGNTKQRKELRQGWNNKYQFNVCVTSYTLASRDAHVFKRKAWYYMILDEAHMIKNFRSQRWNILLMFRSFRRLLLTGTPLQNNLTELWALLQFLMSGTNFANLKEFGDWFANPLEKAIEMGTMDDETQQRVSKLHMVLRPYLLRRLKRDVEKELPQKFEHLVMCPLSKRQRFLYDEFMARADTRHDLQSGVYQKIANILMQLRKVVNHPDLFEVRPIVTSFAMERSAIADFEIKELLVRRRLLAASEEEQLNLDLLGLQFIQRQNMSYFASAEVRSLDGTPRLPTITELPGEPPPRDTRTILGFKRYREWSQRAAEIAKWTHFGYINRLRCSMMPIYSQELIHTSQRFFSPLLPLTTMDRRSWAVSDKLHSMVKSYADRVEGMASVVDRFTFATPAVVARDLPRITLAGHEEAVQALLPDPEFDSNLHRAAVKLQIAFPDPSLLQYDCGKLQELAKLLRERKAGGHRILIFTQMTRILDILETFLNFHGYLYLRLDGSTKIEDRQYITERFNSDSRVFCFISSSRSGGVGINLTGADTVIFYDSDFNPQMDRQCEDRAHRIGQIRDVHIYRFVSTHTVEEALLRKANQKRTLDNIVIQKGEFDWHSLFSNEAEKELTKALGDVEDEADALAAAAAAREEVEIIGEDERDFEAEGSEEKERKRVAFEESPVDGAVAEEEEGPAEEQEAEEDDEEGGTTVDYMLAFVRSDMEHFADWRL